MSTINTQSYMGDYYHYPNTEAVPSNRRKETVTPVAVTEVEKQEKTNNDLRKEEQSKSREAIRAEHENKEIEYRLRMYEQRADSADNYLRDQPTPGNRFYAIA